LDKRQSKNDIRSFIVALNKELECPSDEEGDAVPLKVEGSPQMCLKQLTLFLRKIQRSTTEFSCDDDSMTGSKALMVDSSKDVAVNNTTTVSSGSDNSQWTCSRCTFDNSNLLTNCEICNCNRK